ncbi:cytochrome c oxidase subunit 6b-2-like [Hibiscus syriacus]|uniref:cytochrome c oxidase subunit 6b-2-like n=1 Tax=Hibiscus syriacus TaxID=106335 RepID=UPI001921A818|nr:cytochrome c oxidase subunit 6b-2-like [Hibiscus syriacus]
MADQFSHTLTIFSLLSQIELKTAPADFRFPTTNQTRHCFSRFIEFNRCLAAKGKGSNQCERFAKYYRSLCPGEWIEKWNEQRENGTFQVLLSVITQLDNLYFIIVFSYSFNGYSLNLQINNLQVEICDKT